MLAGDQELGPAALLKEASPVTEAFLFATTLCKLPPPHHILGVLQVPSYFPIICFKVSLINCLTFPLGSMNHEIGFNHTNL